MSSEPAPRAAVAFGAGAATGGRWTACAKTIAFSARVLSVVAGESRGWDRVCASSRAIGRSKGGVAGGRTAIVEFASGTGAASTAFAFASALAITVPFGRDGSRSLDPPSARHSGANSGRRSVSFRSTLSDGADTEAVRPSRKRGLPDPGSTSRIHCDDTLSGMARSIVVYSWGTSPIHHACKANSEITTPPTTATGFTSADALVMRVPRDTWTRGSHRDGGGRGAAGGAPGVAYTGR